MNGFLPVALEVFAVVYLASTGPLVPSTNPLLHGIFLAGLVVMIWAIWILRGEQWYMPDLHPKAKLVTWGPYTIVRHPMYLGLLAALGSMTAVAPSMERWLAFGVLAITLWHQLSQEEQALAKRFPAYKAYMKKTKQLIPFVL